MAEHAWPKYGTALSTVCTRAAYSVQDLGRLVSPRSQRRYQGVSPKEPRWRPRARWRSLSSWWLPGSSPGS